MKHLTKPHALSCLCVFGGIAALCLRLWFLNTGTDDRGLLVTGHPGNILSFVLAALVLLPGIFSALKEPDARQCRAKASPLGALGAALGCAGIAAAAWSALADASGIVPVITGVLGALSVPCLGLTALCRFKGMRTSPALSCVIILFLMLLPVQFYRQWSAEPQLPRYFFQLLGSVCVLLWAFQRFALDAGVGSRRTHLLLRHCGIFFCIAAVAGSTQGLFYLTMAAWMLLDSLAVYPERTAPHEAA